MPCWNSIDRRFGFGRVLDLAGARAAGRAVEPAVRPPLQRVRERVRVVHPEAGEQHFRVAVGHVVLVLVRVEEQVRRLDDVHPAVAEAEPARDVQSRDEVLRLAEDAVLVGVEEDRERSSPFGPCGGGSGTLSQIVRRYWSCFTGLRPA